MAASRSVGCVEGFVRRLLSMYAWVLCFDETGTVILELKRLLCVCERKTHFGITAYAEHKCVPHRGNHLGLILSLHILWFYSFLSGKHKSVLTCYSYPKEALLESNIVNQWPPST